MVGDVVDLETKAQDVASWRLSELISEAKETHDRNLIRRIRRLWRRNAFGVGPKYGERWASILKKVNTEGSTWYVWWIDGVNRFMAAHKRRPF